MTPEQIAAGLTGLQKVSLDLLFFTQGRLNTEVFHDLPEELIDARAEGGLFPQAYPSELAVAVRKIITQEAGGHD